MITKYKIKTNQLYLNPILDLKEKGITINEENVRDNKYDNFTIDYKIILNSKIKGNKTIYNWHCGHKHTPCENKNLSIYYRNFVIKGYFKSPFEDIIAIIVFREQNGYGETWEFPFVVGANLENGYNKTSTNKK